MEFMTQEATEFFASQAPKGPNALVRAMRALIRMIIPVLALMGVFIWADFGVGQPITLFDGLFLANQPQLQPSQWLTNGHFLVALTFLVLNLTNRRYGAAYATAQVTLAWLILGGLVYYYFVVSEQSFMERQLPSVRISVSFVLALLTAQYLSISIFDWTRGLPWWRAPLYSAIWGTAIFCFIFYPSAKYGVDQPWISQMLSHFVLMILMSFLMLVPYFLARPVVKPLPGFGGA